MLYELTQGGFALPDAVWLPVTNHQPWRVEWHCVCKCTEYGMAKYDQPHIVCLRAGADVLAPDLHALDHLVQGNCCGQRRAVGIGSSGR